MIGKDYRTVPAETVSEGISIRWVVGEPDGAPNFALRVIEFEGGAVFAAHAHPYEHGVFVLEGEGIVDAPGGELPMEPGRAIFVPADEVHGYRNTGSGPLRFICVVPNPV